MDVEFTATHSSTCIPPDPGKQIIDALRKIARGRTDCGRPLGGETARKLARDVLFDTQINW